MSPKGALRKRCSPKLLQKDAPIRFLLNTANRCVKSGIRLCRTEPARPLRARAGSVFTLHRNTAYPKAAPHLEVFVQAPSISQPYRLVLH